jgi:DHA1 family inner membrane transport protein
MPGEVRRVVLLCAVATLLSAFGGSILFIALPAISTEFHAGTAELARLGAILSLGSAVAVPLAIAADRSHRGRLAAVGIAGFSVAALATAAAPGVSWLAGARLFAVCFETLVSAIAAAAALEIVAPGSRGRTASLLALAGGAGAALSVVGYPIVAPHWRLLYLAAAPGLLLAPLALRIPSRPRSTGTSGVIVLLAAPWRSRLLVLAASAALGAVLYEPANFFTVFYGSRRLGLSSVDLSLVLTASGVAATAGFVVGGAASDRFGRRSPAVALMLLSALLTALSYTPSSWAYIAANIAWSGLAGAAAPMVGAWTAELVPSRARVTAFTATGVAGALGGVAGLQLVAALSAGLGLLGTLWLAAGIAAVGALAMLALPETRGQPLPD